MQQTPIPTLSPPPPQQPRVLHLDRLGVELPYLAPSYQQAIVGHRELRGAAHQLPAVVVRRGTL